MAVIRFSFRLFFFALSNFQALPLPVCNATTRLNIEPHPHEMFFVHHDNVILDATFAKDHAKRNITSDADSNHSITERSAFEDREVQSPLQNLKRKQLSNRPVFISPILEMKPIIPANHHIRVVYVSPNTILLSKSIPDHENTNFSSPFPDTI